MKNIKTLIEREFDAFFEFETDNRDVVTSTSAKLFAEHVVGIATAPESPAVRGEPEIEPYDAGSLNDFGGGDVGWWHDYIRAELDRAYEFYLIQLAAAPQPAPTTPTGGESDE